MTLYHGIHRMVWLGVLWAGSVLAAPTIPDPRPVVRLASSDWAPFTAASLPEQGSTTTILRQMLAQAGYRLEVVWLPWARTIRDGIGHRPGLDGYFPEYQTHDTERRCKLSAPIGSSVLGLAYLPGRVIDWETISDLSRYRVGVVSGYANSDAFDAAVASGQLPVDVASSDISNLRKLVQRRIDVAVIDHQVMHYLLERSPLRNETLALEFHSRWLAEHPLRVCFRHDARLQPVLDALARHAPSLPTLRQRQRSYLKQLAAHPG